MYDFEGKATETLKRIEALIARLIKCHDLPKNGGLCGLCGYRAAFPAVTAAGPCPDPIHAPYIQPAIPCPTPPPSPCPAPPRPEDQQPLVNCSNGIVDRFGHVTWMESPEAAGYYAALYSSDPRLRPYAWGPYRTLRVSPPWGPESDRSCCVGYDDPPCQDP